MERQYDFSEVLEVASIAGHIPRTGRKSPA